MEKYFFKGYTASLLNHLFQVILVTYLVLLLIEQIWQGSVSLYLNLNYLLVLVILAGILDVFSEHTEKRKNELNWKDYAFIVTLGILGFIIIKFKTSSLGGLSWLISIIAGILIILISILVIEEDENENKYNFKKYRKNEKHNKEIFILGIVGIFLILNIISLILTWFTSLTYVESLRIVFGSVYVLFIPGFILSYIFFKDTNYNDEDEGIDWLERIALSFALSIAVVPLVIFYLNLIGLKINLFNTFFTVLGIIIISSVILIYKNNRNGKYNKKRF